MIGRVLKVAWAPAAVVLSHGAYATLFGHPPALDLVMHPLGGLAVAYATHTAIPMLRSTFGRLTATSHCLLVLGVSFIVANAWEYVEFAVDLATGSRVQRSVEETMVDLLLGTGAATVFVAGVYLQMRDGDRRDRRGSD